MDEELSLLEAIRERPGSRQMRLVYADWLEDQGDPRAAFIRLQCSASRSRSSSPQRLALEAEADALLFRHEADWLGPLLGHVSNWEFHGGLIRSVSVPTDAFLANAEAWLPRLPLLGLHLRKARGHGAALAACPQLAHVTALYLGDNDLEVADLRALFASPYLGRVRELYLQSNHLTDEVIELLASSPRLPRLRDLNVGMSHLKAAAVKALVGSPHLPCLRHLNFTMALREGEGVKLLAGSELLGRLRTLVLTVNFLPPGCLKALAGSPPFAQMRTLIYDMNDSDHADVLALASSPYAKNLKALSLSSNRTLSDASLTALATSPNLGRLRFFSFGPCELGRAGLRALGRSRSLPSLRTLHLSAENDRLRANLPALLRGRLVRRLHGMNFGAGPLGAAGLEALLSHRPPLSLEKLDLMLGPADAPAWEALLARGTLSRLTHLSLSDLPPTSLQAMLAPGRLPQLRKLWLAWLPPDLAETRNFLNSSLVRQLHGLALGPREDEQGQAIVDALNGSPARATLRDLGLSWSLTPDHARALVAGGPWPQLTSLTIGSYRLGTAGMEALAGWPVLRQLRLLSLHNVTSHRVLGLEHLANSPHLGELLRIDIHNGTGEKEGRALLRQRIGGRLAGSGRLMPRVVTVGHWGKLMGDDD